MSWYNKLCDQALNEEHKHANIAFRVHCMEKVIILVAASQHRGTSVGERIPIARGQKWLCFGQFSLEDPSMWIFSITKM